MGPGIRGPAVSLNENGLGDRPQFRFDAGLPE